MEMLVRFMSQDEFDPLAAQDAVCVKDDNAGVLVAHTNIRYHQCKAPAIRDRLSGPGTALIRCEQSCAFDAKAGLPQPFELRRIFWPSPLKSWTKGAGAYRSERYAQHALPRVFSFKPKQLFGFFAAQQGVVVAEIRCDRRIREMLGNKLAAWL